MYVCMYVLLTKREVKIAGYDQVVVLPFYGLRQSQGP